MSKRRHRRDSNKKTTKGQFWSDEEHRKFVEGVAKFGAKAVNDISDYVGTRTPVQVRSHAQKYFIRLARDEAAKAMADEPDKAEDRPSPEMVHALMNARLRERAALKKHKSFEHAIISNDGHNNTNGGHDHTHGNGTSNGMRAVFTAGGHTGQSVVSLTPEAVREAKRQRHALHVAQRKRRQARKARLANANANGNSTGNDASHAANDEKNEEDDHDNTHDSHDDDMDESSSSNHSDSNYSDNDTNDGHNSKRCRTGASGTKKIGDNGHYKKVGSRKRASQKKSTIVNNDNDKENDYHNDSAVSSSTSGGKVKPQQPIPFDHDSHSNSSGNGNNGNDDTKLKYESDSFTMPPPRPPYGMSINVEAPSIINTCNMIGSGNGNGATCVRVHSPGVSLPHPSQLTTDSVKQEPNLINTPVKPVASLPLPLPSLSIAASSSPLSSMVYSSPMSTASACSCSDATPPNFPPSSIYHYPNYHRCNDSSPSLPSSSSSSSSIAPLVTINPNSNHAPLSRQLLSPLAPFRASPVSVPPISLLSCTVHGVDADVSHNHTHTHTPIQPHGGHITSGSGHASVSSLPLPSMIRMPLSSLPRTEPVPIPASRTPMMAAARIQPFWPIGDHTNSASKVSNRSDGNRVSMVKQEKTESMTMVSASGLLSTPSMTTIGRDSPMASMRSSLFPQTKMVPTRDNTTSVAVSSSSMSLSGTMTKNKVTMKAKERSLATSASSSSKSSTATSKALTRKPKVSRSSVVVYNDETHDGDQKRATVQPKARGTSSVSSQLSSTRTPIATPNSSHDNDHDACTQVQYKWLPPDVYTNNNDDAIHQRIDDHDDDYNDNDDDDHAPSIIDGERAKKDRTTKHERTHSRVVDQRYEMNHNGSSTGGGIMLYRVRWCTTMISRPSAIWFYSPSCRRRCDKYESIRHLATSKWPISNGGTGGYKPSSPKTSNSNGNDNANDVMLSSDPPSSPDTDGSTSSSLSSSALSIVPIGGGGSSGTGERRRCRQLTGDIPRIIPSDSNQSAGRIIGTSHTRGGRRRQAWHVIWQDTWEPIQLLTRDIHRHWTVHCKQYGLPVPPPFGMDPDHATSSSTASSSSSSNSRNESKSKKRYRHHDNGSSNTSNDIDGNGNGTDTVSNTSIITHKRIQKATPKVLAMTSFGSSLSSLSRSSQTLSSSSVTSATHRRTSSNPTYDRTHGHHSGHTPGNGGNGHHRTLSAPATVPTLNGTLVNDVGHTQSDDLSNYLRLRLHDHAGNHNNGGIAMNHHTPPLSHGSVHHSQPYMMMAANNLSGNMNGGGGVDAATTIDSHHHRVMESPHMIMRTLPMDSPVGHDNAHHVPSVGILTPQRSWPSMSYASPSPSSSPQKQVYGSPLSLSRVTETPSNHHHHHYHTSMDHDTSSLSLSSSSSSSSHNHNQSHHGHGHSEVDGFLADVSPIPMQHQRIHDATMTMTMTTPRSLSMAISQPSSQSSSSSSLSSLQLSPIPSMVAHDALSFSSSSSSNDSGNGTPSTPSTSSTCTPTVGATTAGSHMHMHGHGSGVSFSFSVSSISAGSSP